MWKFTRRPYFCETFLCLSVCAHSASLFVNTQIWRKQSCRSAVNFKWAASNVVSLSKLSTVRLVHITSDFEWHVFVHISKDSIAGRQAIFHLWLFFFEWFSCHSCFITALLGHRWTHIRFSIYPIKRKYPIVEPFFFASFLVIIHNTISVNSFRQIVVGNY